MKVRELQHLLGLFEPDTEVILSVLVNDEFEFRPVGVLRVERIVRGEDGAIDSALTEDAENAILLEEDRTIDKIRTDRIQAEREKELELKRAALPIDPALVDIFG